MIDDVTVTAPRAPWAPRDPLGEALHLLRMRGAFYSRAELTDPWALEMPAIADSVSFHVVSVGACRLEVPDAEPVDLQPGDLALVPHGRGHTLRGAPGGTPAPRVDLLPQRYLGEHYSVLTYGGGGPLSRLICGIVAFDEPAARELLAALPTVLHVRSATSAGPTSIHDTLRLMSAELADLRPGGETVTTRLADILVVQGLRTWLESDPAARSGWLGALADPRIGRALTAIHRDPGRAWNLTLLAREATMSRSSFAARFVELVGEPPMGYLTRWRMNLAHARLRDDAVLTVAQLAAALGYQSEAAFSRAFTRTIGRTPGSVRHARRVDPGTPSPTAVGAGSWPTTTHAEA